jgi:hypothetical protein
MRSSTTPAKCREQEATRENPQESAVYPDISLRARPNWRNGGTNSRTAENPLKNKVNALGVVLEVKHFSDCRL